MNCYIKRVIMHYSTHWTFALSLRVRRCTHIISLCGVRKEGRECDDWGLALKRERSFLCTSTPQGEKSHQISHYTHPILCGWKWLSVYLFLFFFLFSLFLWLGHVFFESWWNNQFSGLSFGVHLIFLFLQLMGKAHLILQMGAECKCYLSGFGSKMQSVDYKIQLQ